MDKEIKKLQDQVIKLVGVRDKVRSKLEEAALQLYDVRLGADAEAYHRATLDTVRSTLDKCVKMLG